ncbi:PREDICTED: uncharacterized protein LOC106116408 [Papilio xuthus]|uniref:Uncharacterized protein LOC106116408 n=1 Tax=Papilio xuthus TaxID=66420 RepID=A0AAJ6Z5H7_PAPXU|nr:PREDICTED: uncharacterized protein LOC106116408 [Papilio xuthus]
MALLLVKQRDLVVTLKKETVLNIEILSKLYSTSHELTRLINKENWLEKPTQNLFNHLSYYLVNIIDHTASLTWPLYDTNSERIYRNEISNFINSYSNKGLLTPVMSSYLVNPACYKVTMLMFQLSQLAVQSELTSIMLDSQKNIYKKVTDKYKNKDEDFNKYIDNETQVIFEELNHCFNKRKTYEIIAELFRISISKMEAKLHTTNPQNYINNLVDTYINKYQPNENVRNKLLEIKDIDKPCDFFDICLIEVDNKITELETNWVTLITPLLTSGRTAVNNSKELIGRRTGEVDRNLFVVEYNSQTDSISTLQLQQYVNTEQKYILKNIEKDDRLNFPNLIRSFLIAICYILKNNNIVNEIDKFNDYLNNAVKSYSEIKSAMEMLNDRVLNAESKLPVIPNIMLRSESSKKAVEIPQLPDLSILKTHRDKQFLFENFTPMRMSKHEFNLRRKPNLYFNGPQTKSLTTLFSISRDDFLKSRISCKMSVYDNSNITQNYHNFSLISHGNKVNETIAECSSGFTTQQITRLLSTKKTSSSKKFKYKTDRPEIIKKGCLFNESVSTNESIGLIRCHSSPNLFENIERKPLSKLRPRKLSIMQEDSPSLLEVSGIAMLDRNSNCNTPQSPKHQNNSNPQITPTTLHQKSPIFKSVNFNMALNNEKISLDYNDSQSPNNYVNATPKTNGQLIAKTNSLEKIINRYKKVRAVATETKIVEEKENNIVNKVSTNILPDIVNATPNILNLNDDWFLNMDAEQIKRARQSLGTVLGVDHTFLDSCELID